MIEVRMERVIDNYGNMALKIRKLKGLAKKDLPYRYTGSTDVRCWLTARGTHTSMDIVGIKGKHLPSPWDLDDEARQPYPMDSAYLMQNHVLGYPSLVATLGLIYEAGHNLLDCRGQVGTTPPDPDQSAHKMELLLHLSPKKDGHFDKKDWKGFVTVKI